MPVRKNNTSRLDSTDSGNISISSLWNKHITPGQQQCLQTEAVQKVQLFHIIQASVESPVVYVNTLSMDDSRLNSPQIEGTQTLSINLCTLISSSTHPRLLHLPLDTKNPTSTTKLSPRNIYLTPKTNLSPPNTNPNSNMSSPNTPTPSPSLQNFVSPPSPPLPPNPPPNPIQQSRPLTHTDCDRIRTEFAALHLQKPPALHAYTELLAEQTEKGRRLLSKPGDESMAAHWSREMEAMKEVVGDWVVTVLW